MDNSDKYALAEKICWHNQYYNSKLEMLWGAYFENKKINFEHETERRIYDKENNLYYTPDFTLVNFLNGCENLYVEIKPELTEKYIEEQKYAKFIQGESGKRKDNLLLVGGYPWGIYSKSYDYQLYTKSIVGVTVYGKEQLKSQKRQKSPLRINDKNIKITMNNSINDIIAKNGSNQCRCFLINCFISMKVKFPLLFIGFSGYSNCLHIDIKKA